MKFLKFLILCSLYIFSNQRLDLIVELIQDSIIEHIQDDPTGKFCELYTSYNQNAALNNQPSYHLCDYPVTKNTDELGKCFQHKIINSVDVLNIVRSMKKTLIETQESSLMTTIEQKVNILPSATEYQFKCLPASVKIDYSNYELTRRNLDLTLELIKQERSSFITDTLIKRRKKLLKRFKKTKLKH
jgi:hypothetical protein